MHFNRLQTKMLQFPIIIDMKDMKISQAFTNLVAPTIKKYIPSPEATVIILNYFVYNNFQDFNTWQQIAKTKAQFDFSETNKAGFLCKVTLKWEDRLLPTLIQTADAKSKRTAKRTVLKKLIESIIYQGLIAQGFKQQNFVQKLPRRRKNDSDQSDQQRQQEKYPGRTTLKNWLYTEQYMRAFQLLANEDNPKWLAIQMVEMWTYGLNIKSVDFLRNILRVMSSGKVEECYEFQKCNNVVNLRNRQFFDGKQVKDPLSEDLTDFIRYYQLQKGCISKLKAFREPKLNVRPIPSQQVLSKAGTNAPSRQQLIQHFHPIQGRKLFLLNTRKNTSFLGEHQEIEIPRFEQQRRQILLKNLQKIYDILPYYCQDYTFVENVIKMMRQQITSVNISFDQSIRNHYRQQGEHYYLNLKNLWTAQFTHLLHVKLANLQTNVALQGMIMPLKSEEQVFLFNCKEPEQIMNRKINRKGNQNQFEEMREISINQFVALISKVDKQTIYIGQVMQLTPQIKVYIPGLVEQTNDPLPFTMIRIYNAKIYFKTSSSIINVAKNYMQIIEQNSNLIWQPPSFPTLSVIAELLVEWQTARCTVLIVSLNAQILYSQLQNMGFKMVKLSPKIEQKLLIKCNIVIGSPSACCCDQIKNYAFTRVLIQSAHQISQVISLSAIVKGCEELFLMGDPYLPRMFVGSSYCRENDMGVSLMERHLKNGKPTQSFISKIEQSLEFRNVMEWADLFVYNKQLRLLSNEQQKPIIKGFPWPSYNYRICLLHHPFQQNQSDYLNEQAYICASICAQVVKSGYTTIEQITCSAVSIDYLPYLQRNITSLLKGIKIIEPRLFSKNMQRLCRMVSGSIYFQGDLNVVMLGCSSSIISFREITASLSQGRRGVVLIGDIDRLSANEEYAAFAEWCIDNKLLSKFER